MNLSRWLATSDMVYVPSNASRLACVPVEAVAQVAPPPTFPYLSVKEALKYSTLTWNARSTTLTPIDRNSLADSTRSSHRRAARKRLSAAKRRDSRVSPILLAALSGRSTDSPSGGSGCGIGSVHSPSNEVVQGTRRASP